MLTSAAFDSVSTSFYELVVVVEFMGRYMNNEPVKYFL